MAHRRNSAKRVRQHKYGTGKNALRWKMKKELRRMDRLQRWDV